MHVELNKHFRRPFDRYFHSFLFITAVQRKYFFVIWEKALADTSKDSHYPDWSDRYVRDVVAKQGAGAGEWLSDLIARSLPAQYVNDPKYVFGAQGTRMDLLDVMSKADPMTREAFDKGLAVLLGNYGAHTRNTLRSLLRATDQR